MNYAELFDAIRAYTENDFPATVGSGDMSDTEQINAFIRQAETRIYNAVQVPDFRKNAFASTTADNRYLSLPSDWKAVFSISIQDGDGVYSYLLNKDMEFIRESFPDPTDTGLPTYYALFDEDTALLGPTPDDDYTVEMAYFFYPESIVDASTTWLGDNYDPVLLYGTLLEAAVFMQAEEDMIKNYQQRYDEAIAPLKIYAEGKLRQDSYRTEMVRYPVR